MRRKALWFCICLFVASLAFILSCASAPKLTYEQWKPIKNRQCDVPKETVFEKLFDQFVESGYDIVEHDEESGRITTNWKSAGAGNIMLGALSGQRVDYKIMVTIKEVDADTSEIHSTPDRRCHVPSVPVSTSHENFFRHLIDGSLSFISPTHT